MVLVLKFSTGIDLVRLRLLAPLPGEAAQYLMAPKVRKRKAEYLALHPEYRLSSILILLFPDQADNLCTVFIERPVNETIHSGQIAFPGGKKDPSDISLAQTALRETYEEIGIAPESIELIGELSSLFIPASNFLVHPHIGVFSTIPEFRPNPAEVQSLIQIKVSEVLSLKQQTKEFTTSYGTLEAPFFTLHDKTLWGATAMIVSEFMELMGGNVIGRE
jgi:8-oxo-dGTP pyrophosphatase MutT (NUDIX family)